MQRRRSGFLTACGTVALAALSIVAPGIADAARVGVLSNNYFSETAADFNAKIPGHTFTAVDVSTTVPTLSALTTNFDVLLLFEDSPLANANATAVGDVVALYANTGRAVVLGTFYDQYRSDASIALGGPTGWGTLETIDPNTTDGAGTPYAPRSLDAASIVPHPLTTGVTTLTATQFAGGNQAKAGTIVVANWTQKNAKGNPDPAIAYRITGAACVIHIDRASTTSTHTLGDASRNDLSISAPADARRGPQSFRHWRRSRSYCRRCCWRRSADSRSVCRAAERAAPVTRCAFRSWRRRGEPGAAASSSRTARSTRPCSCRSALTAASRRWRADRAGEYVPSVAPTRYRGDRRARRAPPIHGLAAPVAH